MKNKLLIFTLLFLASFLFVKNALAWTLCTFSDGSKNCEDNAYVNQHPSVPCSGYYANISDCQKLETAQTVFWYACIVPSTGNITCSTDQSSGQCGTVQFKTLDNCKNTVAASGNKYQDTTAQSAADAAAAKQAADAKAAADAAAAKQQQEKQAQAKQAIIKDQQAASELMCDCSVKGGQCKDDFLSTQEAEQYCTSCGIVPQSFDKTSKYGGCPLGSKEVGPFSCTCGAGDKASCTTFNTYQELKNSCPSSCAMGNGSCSTPVDSSLKKLQKDALILNPAGFALGSAGIIEIIGKIIFFLVWPLGMFAMALYIYAGFLWMTSQGGEGINKAKTLIIWTTLGVIAALASYMLVQFVFSALL